MAIQVADIKSITLLSLLPGDIMQIDDTKDFNQLLATLQNLHLRNKISSPINFDESLVQYTLQSNDNIDITISIQSPYVCINDIWYLSDFASCKKVTEKANELLH